MSGSIYPKAVITSPDQTVRYGCLSNADIYNKKKLEKTHEKVLRLVKTKKSSIPMKTEAVYLYQQNKPGYYIYGYIQDVVDENYIIFKRAKGKPYKENLKRFTIGSKRYAKRILELRKEAERAKLEAELLAFMPKLNEEVWTSSKGQTLKATFISLKDGKITLQRARKRRTTFALDKLSLESQQRAQKISKLIEQAEKKIAARREEMEKSKPKPKKKEHAN